MTGKQSAAAGPPALELRSENERRVVEFIHQARLADFPDAVIRQARRCFIDLLASSLAGIPSHVGQLTRDFACSLGGAGECTLFGDDHRAPLPLAVLANAMVCGALDCDDGFNPVKGHPGAFLFPTVMAFAERDRLSGRQALEALVVGYEIGIRAGLVVGSIYPTYHGSGSWGGVGTAAVAARAMALTPDQTRHSLGAAEYHGTMAPIMRCVSFPGMVKDAIGWGAFAGVSAAYLARAGFTSTPALFALEAASEWTASLGSRFLIEELYFKLYCCCRWAHPAVRAALKVARENGLDAERIESIVVETFAEACALSRNIPTTSEEAQYSVSYPVAAGLVEGDVGPEQVLEGKFGDPRVLALVSRIAFRYREDFQAVFPGRRLAEVKVVANAKTFTSGIVVAHGDPSDPLSDEEMQDKFRRYASPYLSGEEAAALLSQLNRLEELPDLSAVIRCLGQS